MSELIISEEETKERLEQFINLKWKEKLKWLITLRWFAIVGVFGVITSTRYILKIELPLFPLYLGNIILLAYNILFYFYNKNNKIKQSVSNTEALVESVYNQKIELIKKKSEWFKKSNRFANLQISLNVIMLTYFIHFTG